MRRDAQAVLLLLVGGWLLVVSDRLLPVSWPPRWTAAMASMSALLRIPPTPLMPRLEPSCLSSGSSIELRPPDFLRVDGFSSAAGEASDVSVT